MKHLRSLRYLPVLAALLATVCGTAQTPDGPVGVAVTIKALGLQWGTGSGNLELEINALNNPDPVTATSSQTETPQLTARLEPGKTYFLDISSGNLGDLTIQAVPPPGYVMEIDRIPRERMVLGAGSHSSVRLRVRAPFQEYSGRAGTATSLTSGRIFWQMALGSLANGASAGALAIIDTGTSTANWTDLFSPAGFAYEHTSSEVEVVYRSASDPLFPGTIRQIIAPQVCVDIFLPNSTQAHIKVYHRAQLVPGSGVRSFTGAPFAWYLINQDGSQPNKASINCDLRELPDLDTPAGSIPFHTKHTVIERTGSAPNFTWTADEWYEGAASLSRDVRARSDGVETITVSEPGGATATQGSRTYANVPWGEEIVSETRGTIEPVTTDYSFYTVSAQAGSYGRPSSMTVTGGGWEAYEYYDNGAGTADVAGALHKRHRPFKNSDTSVPANLAAHTGEVTTFDYAPDAFGRRTRPKLVETAVNGTVTARSSTTYADALAGFTGHPTLYLVTATRNDSSADGVTLTTIVKFFREDAGATALYATDDFYRQQLHSIQTPDGRKQSFVYQRGTWTSGSSFTLSANGGANYGAASRISIINGTAATGSAYTSHGGYDLDDLDLVEDKSTMSVTIRDEFARIRRTETQVWHSGDWQLVAFVDFDYNFANQLVTRTSSNHGLYQAQYEGERIKWEQDESGVKVSFGEYDAAGRVKSATRESGGAIGALTTRFSYDAESRITMISAGPETGEKLVTARTYDAAGRLKTETPPGLAPTNFAYNPAASTHTVAFPEGGARIETYFADGQLANVTGSATVEEHYTYEIQPDGLRYTRVNVGSGTSSRLREAWTDWLGRGTKTSQPGWPGQPAFAEENFYEAGTGRLFKTKATGYAPTRYEYDALGQRTRSGLDLGDNGLDPNSSDRITDSDQRFQYDSGAWWLRSETKAYPYANGTAVPISVSRTRLSGHPLGRLGETQSTDADGNLTTQVVDVDRANKTVTITTTQPGLNNQTETLVNGFATSATGPDGLTYTTQYDALLRTQSVTDPRIGATTTTYQSGSTLPSSVSAAAGLLYTCGYDGLGRKTLHTDAAGKNTRYEYNPRGQLLHQWGDGAYPVAYGYHSDFGDHTSLSTYRNASTGDTWPSVGSPDTTTFDYDAATGLLHKKTDAAGKFVEYSYNERGQTHQRFWARTYGGNRVTSTYGYDGNTGELTGITYNDTTPAVGYEYTRLGQLKSATDGVTGPRNFNYDPSKPWRLDHVELSGFYGGRVFTALYEGSGIIGRSRGFLLGSSAGDSSDLEQTYGYNPGGRFETLATKRASDPARTFRYGYLGNSSLVQFLSIDGGHPFIATRGYEPTRDLLTTIESKWNGNPRTRYTYTYNNLYQRDTSKQSGEAFGDYGDSTFSRYTYNPRGELTAAPGYLGSTVTDTSKPLPGRQHGYDYDSIGNRKSTNRTGNSSDKESYHGDNPAVEGANQLNQYETKQNKTIAVQGTVDSANTTVTVSGVTAAPGRQGRYWAAEAPVANSTDPWSSSLTVQAAKTTTGGTDLTRTDTRTAQLAQALQSFRYDEDGNMTSDGLWDYQWDAENRLYLQSTTTLAADAGLPNRVLSFRYDYQGRRVQKLVLDGGTNAIITSRRYLYTGWNLVAEFEAPGGTTLGSLVRSYTWGLDLAGSLTASGGVGALLQIYDYTASKTLLPTYDGNGNLASLLNADTGTIEAAYEYDSFGQLLRCEGAYAKENPFRFSTKFQDQETGLVYYGHRYYAPGLGRFINRDPIAEAGGLNLYGFCGNDGVNKSDYLGHIVVWIQLDGGGGGGGGGVSGFGGDGGDGVGLGVGIWIPFPGGGGGGGIGYVSRQPGTASTADATSQPQGLISLRVSSPTDARAAVAPNSVTRDDLRFLRDVYTEATARWWREAPESVRMAARNGGYQPYDEELSELSWLINVGVPLAARLHNRYRDESLQVSAEQFDLGNDGHLQYLLIVNGTADLAKIWGLFGAGELAAIRMAASARAGGIGLEDANFAQIGINRAGVFSPGGIAKYSALAGRTIRTADDLAGAIRAGDIKASQVAVDYVVVNGQKVILNTRTSTALARAGVPQETWAGRNVTGLEVPGMPGVKFDDLARAQTFRSKLPLTGTPIPPR